VKAAKEWAAEVVVGPDRDVGRKLSRLQDPEDEELYVWLREQWSSHEENQRANDARAIIERLVERVQADACASLEDPLVEVRAALLDIRRYAARGSLEEEYCERLLPKIEEALR
jgi:hypothetical protein